MDDYDLAAYLAEIVNQKVFVVLATEALNTEMLLHIPHTRKVFFYLQAILNHSANISKIIWGAPGKKADQAQKDIRTSLIQDALQINDTSALHSRTMRNNLEHFDERLDKWAVDPMTNGNRVDFSIGANGGTVFHGAPPQVFFRQYDPMTRTIRFFNDDIDMHVLFMEVIRVADLASAIHLKLTGFEI